MKDLRIVFMGTPDFAVASLDKLIQWNYKVVGVVTAPDRPAGRGQRLRESAIKNYVRRQNLRLAQPASLRNSTFLRELQAWNAHLYIVVGFRMLPEQVWQMPKYGTVNLHASLLPDYRGAAPINWAIINGETETGVTTFFIDEKIDTGAIILQAGTPIGPDETAGELHDRLKLLGADLVLRTVNHIEANTAVIKTQEGNGGLKKAPKIDKDTCKINWGQSIEAIYNLIRGLSPYPAAWTTFRNGKDTRVVKIYKAGRESGSHRFTPGKLIAGKDTLKVAVEGGYIDLLEIQLAGKKRLFIGELLHGLVIAEDAQMF